jgi:hypothetical protein
VNEDEWVWLKANFDFQSDGMWALLKAAMDNPQFLAAAQELSNRRKWFTNLPRQDFRNILSRRTQKEMDNDLLRSNQGDRRHAGTYHSVREPC